MVLLVRSAVRGALRCCAMWTAVAPFRRENDGAVTVALSISAYNARMKIEILYEECDLHLRTQVCRLLAYRG